MISFRFLVARGGAATSPLAARHKAAVVLLVLLALAITVVVFLLFAAVGLVIAVPVLIAAGIAMLWRRGRQEVMRGHLVQPPAVISGEHKRALPGGRLGSSP